MLGILMTVSIGMVCVFIIEHPKWNRSLKDAYDGQRLNQIKSNQKRLVFLQMSPM